MSRIDDTGTQYPEVPLDLVRIGPPREPLSPFLVMFFYARGVFPWMEKDQRRLWWSPEPRSVVFPPDLHVSRSLRKKIKQGRYRVTADTAFRETVTMCRLTRSGDDGPGSWITPEIIDVFTDLHRMGHAHSIEAWEGDQLVGGLYGLCLGQMFYGCSMFHTAPDASKVAFVKLVEVLARWNFPVIDCQIQNSHLKGMGGSLVPREQFHQMVGMLVRGKRRVGPWTRFFT